VEALRGTRRGERGCQTSIRDEAWENHLHRFWRERFLARGSLECPIVGGKRYTHNNGQKAVGWLINGRRRSRICDPAFSHDHDGTSNSHRFSHF